MIELAESPGGGGVGWTGNIVVSQVSSFRTDGNNVTIDGTLTLATGSDGFFNKSNWSGSGTFNSITGGVTCTSTTDHVQGPGQVVPPVPLGLPPACSPF